MLENSFCVGKTPLVMTSTVERHYYTGVDCVAKQNASATLEGWVLTQMGGYPSP